MLNQQNAAQKAAQIVCGLGSVPAREALNVLQLAIAEVLNQSTRSDELSEELDCKVVRLRPGRVSMIELDDELRAYIHTFTVRDTVAQIAHACVVKFGSDRAPSKSSIHRYLVTLKYRGRKRR